MAGIRIQNYSVAYSGKNTNKNISNKNNNGISNLLGNNNTTGNKASGANRFQGGYALTLTQSGKSEETRSLLRDLNRDPARKTDANTVKNEDMVTQLSGKMDKSDDKLKVKEKYKYRYKDVSTKIRTAKTSQTAGQAEISAKRKVAEIKRKMTSGSGDADELQMALSHAKRMEMAARKKKHNLELEELVEHTQKSDENLEKLEQAASEVQSSTILVAEDKVAEEEDKIFDQREAAMDEIHKELEEADSGVSEETMADLNEMVAEIGEEELEELENAMQSLEELEVVDPHMSEQDLKELKTKHRNAENKAMMKADMDYLKAMIKHYLKDGGSTTSSSSATNAQVSGAPIMTGGSSSVQPLSIDLVVSADVAAAPTTTVDIQV